MNNSIIVTSPPMAEPVTLTEAKLHLRVDSTADDTLIPSLITATRQYCELFQGRTYMATTYQMKIDMWSDIIYLPNVPLWSVDSITYVDTAGTTQTLSTDIYSVDKNSEPGFVYLAYLQNWPSIRGTHSDITINYSAGYSCTYAVTDVANNICTAYGRTFTEATRVRLYNSDGAVPAGLAADTDYYARDIAGSTFKLYAAATGGSAIDLTGAGTGIQYIGRVPETIITAIKLLLTHFYEHREEVSCVKYETLPFGAKNLLWLNKITSSDL
jgi:uncharacterized phiE125 gp8 family phage protein